MSLQNQGSPTKQPQNHLNRGKNLNPHAQEFVPLALRANQESRVAEKLPASAAAGKRVLDRSESSISANSEEEARQYWQQQLPDDITPDFKVAGEEEQLGLGVGSLSLAGLSLQSSSGANRFSTGGYKINQAHPTNGDSLSENMGFPMSGYAEDLSYIQSNNKPGQMQLTADLLLGKGRQGYTLEQVTTRSNPNDMADEYAIIENNNMQLVQFLASQFPGFAAESLAEVLYANGGDINLTMEMLTQLEVCGILILKLIVVDSLNELGLSTSMGLLGKFAHGNRTLALVLFSSLYIVYCNL